MQPPHLILASASPRRRQLLRLLQLDFTVHASKISEDDVKEVDPRKLVENLAQAKARAVQTLHPDAWVLGADTIVFCDGEIFGKPSSEDDARSMLERLSGRVHHVMTGVCLCRYDQCDVSSVRTSVWFYSLSAEEIEDYLCTGETRDKAGAYAVQGYAARFIEKIDGCYFNVVGLPVSHVYRRLKQMGFPLNG